LLVLVEVKVEGVSSNLTRMAMEEGGGGGGGTHY